VEAMPWSTYVGRASKQDFSAFLWGWGSNSGEASRCLVPGFDGASSAQAWKDALWARFHTGAPA
jgi:hypothetical protein